MSAPTILAVVRGSTDDELGASPKRPNTTQALAASHSGTVQAHQRIRERWLAFSASAGGDCSAALAFSSASCCLRISLARWPTSLPRRHSNEVEAAVCHTSYASRYARWAACRSLVACTRARRRLIAASSGSTSGSFSPSADGRLGFGG